MPRPDVETKSGTREAAGAPVAKIRHADDIDGAELIELKKTQKLL